MGWLVDISIANGEEWSFLEGYSSMESALQLKSIKMILGSPKCGGNEKSLWSIPLGGT